MCEVEGCEGRAYKRRMCNRHYLRWRRHGDPSRTLIRRYGPDSVCEAEGCTSFPLAKGLCRWHYDDAKRVYEPEVTVEQRFWAKVDKTDTCWLWTGALTKEREGEGYGQFRIEGAQVTAHRFSWESLHGGVPEGLVLDHLCRVRRCVNPQHLEIVTPYENMMRGEGFPARQSRQTHCKRGHPLSGDNVRIVNGGRSRRCLACKRLAYHTKKK